MANTNVVHTCATNVSEDSGVLPASTYQRQNTAKTTPAGSTTSSARYKLVEKSIENMAWNTKLRDCGGDTSDRKMSDGFVKSEGNAMTHSAP